MSEREDEFDEKFKAWIGLVAKSPDDIQEAFREFIAQLLQAERARCLGIVGKVTESYSHLSEMGLGHIIKDLDQAIKQIEGE